MLPFQNYQHHSAFVVALHLGSPGTENMESSFLSTRPWHMWHTQLVVSCRLCRAQNDLPLALSIQER